MQKEMYLAHYNLTEMPFQIGTDPKFIWLGKTYQEALAFLKYGALYKKGFVLITGDLGTGKTTLVNVLLDHCDKDIITAYVANPVMEEPDFLYRIGNEFTIDMKFGDKEDFLKHLSRFLNMCNSENKKVILIIDEAHRMSQELLDSVQLLSNIKRQDKELLNIIFVGQDEFADIISHKKNLDLKQKITINFHINPLKRSEMSEYILHRLNIAGSVRNIFTAKAIGEIFSFSKGYPRLINIMCDHALLSGHVKGVNTIDAEIIKECVDELHLWTEKINDGKKSDTYNKLKHEVLEKSPSKPSKKVKMVIISVLALFFLGLLYHYDIFSEHPSSAERYFRESSNSPTLLTSIDIPQIKDSDKNISPVGHSIKNSRETIFNLQQKQPLIIRSATAVTPLHEKRRVDDKPTPSIHVKEAKLNGSKHGIQQCLYTIYLHYANIENRELMEELAISLKNKGFGVLGIEKVDYQNNDIRYFHRNDIDGAFILKKHLTQFITSYDKIKNTNIKIKNLSRKYPNAQKGSLELWLNF